MKNRKAPVLLFGVVVIALGGMTVFNAMQKPQTDDGQKPDKEEAAAKGTATDQDRAAVGKSLLNKLGTKKGEKKNKAINLSQSGDNLMTEPAKEPTIFLRSTTNYRPVPNDASTASHWYDDESRSAQLAAENAKGKG